MALERAVFAFWKAVVIESDQVNFLGLPARASVRGRSKAAVAEGRGTMPCGETVWPRQGSVCSEQKGIWRC